MDTIGIRELKTHLSRHLKRVRGGARLTVTERGRAIATIAPIDAPVEVGWAHQLVADGLAQWKGGKPAGLPGAPSTKGRRASTVVIEDCR